jgi:hypothetical protein
MVAVRTLTALVATVALSIAAVDAGAAEQRLKGSLRVESFSPLVVKGVRFRAFERVTLTVAAGGEMRRRYVRATRAGLFQASFPTLTADRCNSDVWARAAGRLGSRASLRLGKLPQLQCPPGIP